MKPSRRVLVVDPDGVFRRFVELTLGAREWLVESVRDSAGASELLQGTRFDAIICEANLPDAAGLHLHRRLLQATRLRTVPFLLVSSDERVRSQVAALRAGVDDYLVKPIDAELLTARLDAHVWRALRAREGLKCHRYLLAGDFAALSLPDLISTLSLQHQTGVVWVTAPRALGLLYLVGGNVVHAVYGTLVGEDAVFGLFAEETARFEFTPEETPLAPELRSIHSSVTELFLEAARRADEGALPVPSTPSQAAPSVGALPHPPERGGDAALAAQFVASIADVFSLGQLMVWVGAELGSWIRREGHGSRLHIHLVADLGAGIADLLTVTSPASERQVMAGLRSGPKAVGLVFLLRNEKLIDLVLVDIDNPTASLHNLVRTPAITILAPRGGDAFEVEPKARVGLDALLRARPPAMLVGVGGESMTGLLEQLRPAGTEVLRVPGALDDGELDFRQLLVSAVSAWGHLEEP